jgi:hypothetical protein
MLGTSFESTNNVKIIKKQLDDWNFYLIPSYQKAMGDNFNPVIHPPNGTLDWWNWTMHMNKEGTNGKATPVRVSILLLVLQCTCTSESVTPSFQY